MDKLLNLIAGDLVEPARGAFLPHVNPATALASACLAGSRILVEQSLYARFRDDLVARARSLAPGDPLAPTSTQGAIASQAQLDKIASTVDRARAEGGRVLAGGERVVLPPPLERGFYYAPTVI